MRVISFPKNFLPKKKRREEDICAIVLMTVWICSVLKMLGSFVCSDIHYTRARSFIHGDTCVFTFVHTQILKIRLMYIVDVCT